MVDYFKKNLKLFIKTKINQDAYQLNNFEKRIIKVIKAKAKPSLQLGLYVCKTNFIAFKTISLSILLLIRYKPKVFL